MNAVVKPQSGLTPAQLAEIDRIVYEIRTAHELRQDGCETLPLKRRGRRIKKRPNTAVIVAAIARKRLAVDNRGASIVALQKLLYGKAPK